MVIKKTRVLKLVDTPIVKWEETLESFLLWKKAEGKAERTIKDYGYHVRNFLKCYPDAVLNQPVNLRNCIISYLAEPAKPAYYNNKMVYLKTFFNWCVSEGLVKENPLNGFKRRKADHRIVQIDMEIIKKLLAMPDHTTFPGLRDYALILLQLDTGIRPKEALSLLITDTNLIALEIYVRAENAKTRISRTLPISQFTSKAIEKLLKVRPVNWDEEVPVFCTCEGAKMLVNGWCKRVNRYGAKLGIQMYPYQFRHTFALEFLRNGGNSFSLQKTMGHTDLNMTRRYVALADIDIKRQHLIASPVANLVCKTKRLRNL